MEPGIFLALVVSLGVAAVAATWLIGKREPVFRTGTGKANWFVAVKFRDANTAAGLRLAAGVTEQWSAAADFGFIGPATAYWDRFMILSGEDPTLTPIDFGAELEDAFLARVALVRPPALALGLVRALALLGIWRAPRGKLLTDPAGLESRPDVMPDAASIATLLAQPANYAPAMVNFLAYYDEARYQSSDAGAPAVSGGVAYNRYGRVALQSVYHVGGHLLFYGRIVRVLRAAAGGPAAGEWHELATMQYPDPEAILRMEQLPRYRAALKHRDAGLARTIVVASSS
jgi:uncharacterized protein (DUF1330 family)